MLAESASVVINEIFCVVLFYVVNFYFYSRLVYSFSAYRKRYDPRTEINASSQPENKPRSMQDCLWWPLNFGGGSTWSQWCQVEVHGTSWSDSSRHSSDIFIGMGRLCM